MRVSPKSYISQNSRIISGSSIHVQPRLHKTLIKREIPNFNYCFFVTLIIIIIITILGTQHSNFKPRNASFLRIPKVHYNAQHWPSLALYKIAQTSLYLFPYIFRYILVLSSHLHVGITSCLAGLEVKILSLVSFIFDVPSMQVASHFFHLP